MLSFVEGGRAVIRLIRGQQGSTLLVAVITMSFLGIFIAGLLPFLSSVGKMGNLTQNQLQAAFAAEAGAKRALVSLARYAYDNSSTSAAW